MKKKTLIITLIIWTAVNIKAQDMGVAGYTKSSPQVSDFIRYGDIPVNLHEGKINVTIPIFEISDKDFPFPVSVSYTSGGFKPGVKAGFVGMDWHLNFGGVITRDVYGMPDEHNGELNILERGFWKAFDNVGYCDYTNSIYNMTYPVFIDYDFYNLPQVDGYWHDYQPDLFHFRFGSHQGNFMIGNGITVKTNKAGYEVDVDGLSTQYVGAHLPQNSEIIIYSPDGYKWYFGGSPDYLEFSFTYKSNQQLEPSTNPIINAWYLSKVISPNGRIMTFSYAQSGLSDLYYESKFFHSRFLERASATTKVYVANKQVFPAEIEINDIGLKITFEKETEETETFFNHYYFNQKSYQLRTIKIEHLEKTQFFDFTYENKTGNTNSGNTKNNRRFLTKIQQRGLNPYIFEYLHPVNYPNPEESLIEDYYGFWKNTTNVSYGQLIQLNYPTGGYTRFEYEQNKCGERVKMTITPSLVPEIEKVSDNVGGCRIRKIKHHDSNNTITSEVEYKYVMEYKKNINLNTAESSGTLFHYHTYTWYRNTGEAINFAYSHNVWRNNYNVYEPHLGYREVVELRDDGAYTIYKFTDYAGNPDSYENVNLKFVPNHTINITDIATLAGLGINAVLSRSYARGLLSEKSVFNNGGNMVKWEVFHYKNTSSTGVIICDPNMPEPPLETDCIVSFRPIPHGGLARKIFLQSCPLIDEYEWMFYGSGTVTKIKQIFYNNYDLVKETKTFVRFSPDTLRVEYSYPFDKTESVYSNMRSYFMLDYPVEIREYKNRIPVKKIMYDYKQFYTGKFAIEYQKSQTGIGSIITDYQYDYDTKLNPIGITNKEGKTTIYLWSYNNQYPVAAIENAATGQVEQVLENAGTNSFELRYDTNPDMETIGAALRAGLPNSMVTVYKWEPFAGKSYEADPTGKTLSYEYDEHGRLIRIKDMNNNILNEYEYNYE